ncbi:MAG: polysaccharide pyruvyl transferase family protein, partial [Lentisphaerae bacterium]|nr:polysaccharide pyruvyl transferase family protein [Lentisphaerota bacterium]
MGYRMLRRAVRVCLLGASPRTGNQGVSALNASLLKLVFEARPDAEVTLLISHRSPGMHAARVAGREHMVRLVNCRLSPRARPREHLLAIVALCLAYRLTPSAAARGRIAALSPWVRALAEADFVGDIRGGDSFSDIYGLGRFMLNAVPALTAMLLGRKLVLLPQTYGPYGSPLARAVAAFTLRRAARVLSRDREGVAAAERLVRGRRGAPRPEFCPDVAFALEARPPPSPVIRPPLDPAAAAPPVGLNVNGLMYRGGYTRGNMFRLKCDYAEYARRLAARILASRPETRLLLVPHTFGPPGGLNSDPDACREVIAALPAGLKERASLVAAGYDQHEI